MFEKHNWLLQLHSCIQASLSLGLDFYVKLKESTPKQIRALMLCVRPVAWLCPFFSMHLLQPLCSVHMQAGWVQGFPSLVHLRCFLTSSWGDPVGLLWHHRVRELLQICLLTLPSINNVSFSFINSFSVAFCCLCSMSPFDQNSM